MLLEAGTPPPPLHEELASLSFWGPLRVSWLARGVPQKVRSQQHPKRHCATTPCEEHSTVADMTGTELWNRDEAAMLIRFAVVLQAVSLM